MAELLDEIYEFEPCGGDLHIVTDDWNLEDVYVDFCIKHAHGEELRCAVMLRAMTVDQRAYALAKWEGWVE